MAFARCAALLAASVIGFAASAPAQQSKLRVELVGSDSTAFDVVSALVVGPTELIVWDAQYHVADARRLADRIAATGKRPKAIIISHPDHDHFMGTAVLVQRFPGTPVYMNTQALAWFDTTAARAFQGEKTRNPTMFADSLVRPQPLRTTHLTVDGEALEVIGEMTGDVIAPTSSVLWIPSLKTVLAGDVVFNDVHPWLGSSDVASRRAWRASLDRIENLRPAIVVAGHKKDVNAADSPASIAFMKRYLADFDSLRTIVSSPEALVAGMKQRHPNLAVEGLLRYAARQAFMGERRAAPEEQPSAPRAVTFPDTLGAAFAGSDSAKGVGTPQDFDFLVGLWSFTFQQRRPDGSFSPSFKGHWAAEKKRVENGFIEDHWRSDNRTRTWDAGTWTYRVFNPLRKLWEMQGVNTEGGAWAPGLCWSDASNRYVIQHYGSGTMRIRYFAITDSSFLWRADLTDDGGKTWRLDWWTMEAKRVAR
jgi:glyoxylase-like metal-dependent hydrolase (beta-lactamase superfamily II)